MFILCGSLALGLAMPGALLPVLPATPFFAIGKLLLWKRVQQALPVVLH